MRPLKKMIDQFVSEDILVWSDNCCDFASPLVIVNKTDGGIRMAVDEFNMRLELTVNKLPYQPTLLQRLGGQYFAKIDNIWVYITNFVY